jgi:hypothetical protein
MMLRLYAVTAKKYKMNKKLQTAFVIIYTCRLHMCCTVVFYLLGINDATFIR